MPLIPELSYAKVMYYTTRCFPGLQRCSVQGYIPSLILFYAPLIRTSTHMHTHPTPSLQDVGISLHGTPSLTHTHLHAHSPATRPGEKTFYSYQHHNIHQTYPHTQFSIKSYLTSTMLYTKQIFLYTNPPIIP